MLTVEGNYLTTRVLHAEDCKDPIGLTVSVSKYPCPLELDYAFVLPLVYTLTHEGALNWFYVQNAYLHIFSIPYLVEQVKVT